MNAAAEAVSSAAYDTLKRGVADLKARAAEARAAEAAERQVC